MNNPTAAMQPDTAGKKLGPIWLTPGIGYGNAAAGIYASFTTIGLLIYLGFVQPYLLTEVLNIPQGEQGSITGRLASLTEVVQIIAMSTIGAVSDQRGRRVIYVLGFVFLGIGYFLYPLADSVLQLTLFRLIFAVGAATIPTMLAAIVIDYSQPISRGKWLAYRVFVAVWASFLSSFLWRASRPGLKPPAWIQSSRPDTRFGSRLPPVFWGLQF